MLTDGLRCAGIDLPMQCIQPKVQCVVGGKSPDLELGRLWLS
jgi:hypothetical protein